MDIGEILGKAWRITWKHKGLWILGILAGCSTSSGGSGGGTNSNINLESGDMGNLDYHFGNSPILQWLSDVPEGIWITLVVLLVLFFIVLSIIFWILGSVGKSGLYAGFKQADETGTTSLKESFSFALHSFWKILVIELVVGIIGFLLILITVIPVTGMAILTMGIGLLCLLPILCILIPVGLIVGVFLRLLEIAVTADKVPFADSLGHVWKLVKKSPGYVIIIALLLGLIGFLLALLIGMPILVIIVPAVAGGLINAEQFLVPGIAASSILLLLYIPIAMFLNGILQTYILGSWTLFYERLKALPEKEKPAADRES